MDRRLWDQMLARSFHPSEWFMQDERDQHIAEGGKLVYVYRKTEGGLFTVGFYDPQRQWHSDRDYAAKEDAAARVNYLNGGHGNHDPNCPNRN